MAETIKVAGLRELGLAMKDLSADIQKKVARQAVAAGAGVIRKAARAKAPKDTGVLRAGIVIKRVKATPHTEEYVVTVSAREMKKYVKKSRSAIVELVGPQREGFGRKLLARKDEYESYGYLYYGRFHEFGTVKMPARPFLRPALEENKMQAIQVMANRLRDRIQKAQAKS